MIRGSDELESAFTTMVRERADALIVQGSLVIKPVTDMAIKYRLPAASGARAFADIGGLMSYGADGPAAFRHSAKFVQRILQVCDFHASIALGGIAMRILPYCQ